jgi:hypothetical protein
MSASPNFNRHSIELLVFGHYLRTGRMGDVDDVLAACEHKFNPYHDPDDGRFTFAPGGGSLAPKSSSGNRAGPSSRNEYRDPPLKIAPLRPRRQRTRTPAPTATGADADSVAKRQRDIGALAAKFESRRLEGPGTISTGRNDPGGVSYGTFQMSSTRKVVHDFVASPEANPWSSQFRGKSPVTQEFDDQWRAIAAGDPGGFAAAQRAFIIRRNYSEGARKVRNEASFELDQASPSVRQAFFSTAVQHGATGGGGLLVNSIRLVDSRLPRSDPRYESALLNALYDQRTEQRRRFAIAARAKAAKFNERGASKQARDWLGKARLAENDANRRYPRERYDALLLLSGRPMSGL